MLEQQMKAVWLSELRTRYARLLGWTALLAAVGSLWPWIEPMFGVKGIGRSFGLGAWLSMASLLLAVIAVSLNIRAARPRSRVPVIALIFAVPLVAANMYVAVALAGLAHMH